MKKTITTVLLSLALFACMSCGAYAKSNVVVESDATFAQVPAQLKKAKWIWAVPSDFYGLYNSYAQFRRSFDLSEVPAKADMFITADQNYRLYINGKFVCSGPARGYQHSWPFDELDVSKFLQKGNNVIAVRCYNGGRSTFGYLTQGRAGLIFSLDLGSKLITSGPGVKCRRQSGCDRDTDQYTLQLNNQEHIDLRAEDPTWKNVDFNDSAWGNPGNMGAFNVMPWYNMEPRMIPMLEEFELPAPKLVAEGTAKSVSDAEHCFNLNELEIAESAPLQAASSDSGTITVPPTPKGEVRNYLLDFGRMNVGMPILKIDGAHGGEIIDSIYEENYNEGFKINNRWKTHSRAALSNRLICRAGDQIHDFYHPQGFRYMLLRVRGNSGELKITPSLRWSAYPLADKGSFETSDALVNDIWKACRQTQKICALDSYVDTPYREQAQWWGDARVQCWNTFFIAGDARLLRRGIRSISMQTVPNGLTYGHAPTMAHTCVLPDFSLTWILTVWDYYWQTGSVEAYASHKDTIDGIISYFESHKNSKTGLVEFDPRYWLFLDWTGIQKQGQPALLNLWYLEALDKMARLCGENGFGSDAARYAELAKKMRDAITSNLLDSDGLLCDGILPDGKRNPSKSIHSQTLGYLTKIKGLDFDKAKKEIILPFIRDGKIPEIVPSSYWVVYTLMALIDDGDALDAFNFIKREWKDMAPFGTVFENYKPDYGGSHAHAWSAHPAFLLPQILGGIKQESAAWKKVSVKPNYFENSAEISYPTPQGDLKVSYKKEADGTYKTNISAPQGMIVEK